MLTKSDPTFDLRWLAETQPAQFRYAVDSVRNLLREAANTVPGDEAEREMVGLVHSLTFHTPACPRCDSLGSIQVPIAALYDGAVYRVDYQCPRCAHEFPVWWEEA
jgi:ribosomal protein S27AE